MCGIAGIYGFNDEKLINTISADLKHRGPDGMGIYSDSSAAILNRRLAIIDREGGKQPIFNEDGSMLISFNGEIYNYRELRNSLKKEGHKFITRSDTEVIIHGYEQWGIKCFDKLNGMFAVAIYEIKKKKLVLARDHFGIKPLYFAFIKSELQANSFKLEEDAKNFKVKKNSTVQQSESKPQEYFNESNLRLETNSDLRFSNLKIIFCSEIKPMINSGLIEKKPNDRIIYRYLRYRIHDDQRDTFFQGIYRLLPGETVEIQDSNLKFRNYSNLKNELLASNAPQELQKRFLSKKQIVEFQSKLVEAIKLRLISEVPVGTCLSGGLDSSLISAVINKLLKEKVKEAYSVGKIQKTFSAVFPNNDNNEERYVQIVTNYIKLENFKISPKASDFFREFEDFIKTQEEPTISTGPYAQYKVMQLAKKYVTVLLDGQGADEMLAGYLPYYFVYLNMLLKNKKLVKFFLELTGSLDILGQYFIYLFRLVWGSQIAFRPQDLLDRNFFRRYKNEIYEPTTDNLKKRLVDDIFVNSLPALLRYEDKNAMRFSLEGRVPFLDINLMKYLFSLPEEAIIKSGWNKYILREASKKFLPEKIILRRNKIGFTTPEDDWFKKLKDQFYEIFLSQSFAKRQYFNQSAVVKAWYQFCQGKSDDTMLFWRLINLEYWLRIFFDKTETKKDFLKNQSSRLTAKKKIEMKVEGNNYYRYPIKTELFKKDDNYIQKIAGEAIRWFNPASRVRQSDHKGRWIAVVSEKIVAIAQGRSYFIWDIKTGFWANTLSKFVKKTPYGIGLGSPWTMQLAINEAGLTRILLATIASVIVKPFGFKGLFYKIAGSNVNAIDGPTEYSLYPSNISAKLGPKNPQGVAENIHQVIVELLKDVIPAKAGIQKENWIPDQVGYDKGKNNFLGVAIIDANDLGQNVLGNTTGLDNKLIEKIFSDNPMGQSNEQTPLVIVVSKE